MKRIKPWTVNRVSWWEFALSALLIGGSLAFFLAIWRLV